MKYEEVINTIKAEQNVIQPKNKILKKVQKRIIDLDSDYKYFKKNLIKSEKLFSENRKLPKIQKLHLSE